MKTINMALFTISHSFIQPSYSFPSTCNPTFSISCKAQKPTTTTKKREPLISHTADSSSPLTASFHQTLGEQSQTKKGGKKRIFFLDVNPICYEGSTPSLHSFARWLSLFLSQVTHTDPVIAVFDGERGSEHRRQLLPSYKAHRRKFTGYISSSQRYSRGHFGNSHQVIKDVLGKCNVPVSCSVSSLSFYFLTFMHIFYFLFNFCFMICFQNPEQNLLESHHTYT
ncbi:putative PIN domain-containing protein [Lupinus albus]|uniref:Putative PIN domain-containing protein n=1 Tax=Lupinus albus TaxID=3870 RepID=A0A6A4QSZ3_LUPAL|nr:putative PIN domain-containing protein [Lupinus albus]